MRNQLIVLAAVETANHVLHSLVRDAWLSPTIVDAISFTATMALTFFAGLVASMAINGNFRKSIYVGGAAWFLSSVVLTLLGSLFFPSEAAVSQAFQGYLISAAFFLPLFVILALAGVATGQKKYAKSHSDITTGIAIRRIKANEDK